MCVEEGGRKAGKEGRREGGDEKGEMWGIVNHIDKV